MNKFIRYYNQNRRELFIIIIIILFGILLLQFINLKVAQKRNEELNENNSNSSKNSSSMYGDNIETYQVVTGEKNDVTATDDIEYIIKFIEYCNDGNISQAYQMISNECKEILFPSLEYFKQSYYQNNFDTQKSYNITNWSSSTYIIEYKEDMLKTGQVNMNNKQDFITVQDNGLLNINNFIEKKNVNSNSTLNNITVDIISKYTFVSYEIYTIKVNNNNEFDIYLDELNRTDGIYLVDENDIKYVSYSHELTGEQLKVNPHSSIEINIKFTNSYIVNRNYQKIIFSNIRLDNAIKEKMQISINLK